MAEKFILEFEEKHHILEVDGVEYEVPERTAAIEEKIAEREKELENRSEYDNNFSLLEILFGKKAAKTMFPDKETTNLDKLSQCAKMALAAYYTELENAKEEERGRRMEKTEEALKRVKGLVSDTEAIGKKISKANTANFVKSKKR